MDLPITTRDRPQSFLKDKFSFVCAILVAIPLLFCVYIVLIVDLEDTRQGLLPFVDAQKVEVLVILTCILLLSIWTMSQQSEIPEQD